MLAIGSLASASNAFKRELTCSTSTPYQTNDEKQVLQMENCDHTGIYMIVLDQTMFRSTSDLTNNIDIYVSSSSIIVSIRKGKVGVGLISQLSCRANSGKSPGSVGSMKCQM